jgi:hypothetical protein
MEEYIKEISEKYGGSITSDRVGKTYTTEGEFLRGKLQTNVTIDKLNAVFAIDHSDPGRPFTSAILLTGKTPKKCTLIPKTSLVNRLLNVRKTLKSVYNISTDSDLLFNILSNDELCDLLVNNKTHIVIRKKDDQRLLVIHPSFSILTKEDYSKLEKITVGIIQCIVSPKLG